MKAMMKKAVQLLLVLQVLVVMCAGHAAAALKSVGPVDLMTTLPAYYQDTANLPLEPCLDQNGFCLLPPPFDPAIPPVSAITTVGPINDANFPAEGFYYSADALLPIEAGELARLTFVLEYAFLSGVAPNTGIAFLRTDLQKMRNLAPSSTYRVTHPYGQFSFTTDSGGRTTGGGGVAVRLEDPAGTEANWMPALMQAAAFTNIGPFLTPSNGVFPTAIVNGETHTYIGDPAVPVTVTGSPTGNNFYRVERLNANGTVAATWQTNLFALAGRVYTKQIASPLTIDRATYARDASTQQIDIFATALPAAALTVSGTGLPATPLAADSPKTGKFFIDIPLAGIPTGVTLTNALDAPPIIFPITLVDEVKISQAVFNPATRDLTIKAASRDKLAPLPVLSVPQFPAPNTLDATGTLVKNIAGTTIPPMTVTVSSSKGGTDTVPISVVAQVLPPVAVNDSAATAKGTAVTISVLANDTSVGTLDPTTVTITAAPPSGATAVPGAAGTVVYTPPVDFTGTETFSYTVKDNLGQTSNTATVSVQVNAPPVAGNDSASAAVGTVVGINVIANDTASNGSINSTTVNIVSAATCGSTSVQANGVVQFTAPGTIPAGPGTCSFSYVVSDTFVPSQISNVATVTVTIIPGVPPVAVNDAAVAATSATVVINVVANDTSATSTINPATVAVGTPTGGTAVANLNGTVSYTAPAVAGTYTFTYTVNDTAVPPATSNAATVTVAVSAPIIPPTAVNDSATVVTGNSVVINVAANDVAGTNPISAATTAVGSAPVNGTALANAAGAGTVTYTPNAGFSGVDGFTYTIRDSAGTVSNSATVSVTVTSPTPTETISVTRAQFTLSSGQWRVDGTTTARVAGQTMKIFNSATVPADAATGLLATVSVTANGTFTWTSANGAPPPNGLRRISILSSLNPNNNKREQITVTVR